MLVFDNAGEVTIRVIFDPKDNTPYPVSGLIHRNRRSVFPASMSKITLFSLSTYPTVLIHYTFRMDNTSEIKNRLRNQRKKAYINLFPSSFSRF